MKISERLYDLRKDKKISQEELANVLGVSRQSVSKWETGESTPDFDKIIPLCEFYGITSDELLTGKKDIIESNKEDRKNHFATNIALSVGLYIFSIVLIILFSTIFDMSELGVSLFLLVVAVATGIIVYSCIKYKDDNEEKKEKKDNKIVKQICEIIDILGVIVYLLVSFLTGAWHVTWIIFIVVGLFEAIVKLIFSLKEEKEGEKENE